MISPQRDDRQPSTSEQHPHDTLDELAVPRKVQGKVLTVPERIRLAGLQSPEAIQESIDRLGDELERVRERQRWLRLWLRSLGYSWEQIENMETGFPYTATAHAVLGRWPEVKGPTE